MARSGLPGFITLMRAQSTRRHGSDWWAKVLTVYDVHTVVDFKDNLYRIRELRGDEELHNRYGVVPEWTDPDEDT